MVRDWRRVGATGQRRPKSAMEWSFEQRRRKWMAQWRPQSGAGGAGLSLERRWSRAELPGVVGRQAGGAADVACVVPGDGLGAQCAGRREVGEVLRAQQGDGAVLEDAAAALDLAFCPRVRGGAVGGAPAEQGALELGADTVGTGVWGGAEE